MLRNNYITWRPSFASTQHTRNVLTYTLLRVRDFFCEERWDISKAVMRGKRPDLLSCQEARDRRPRRACPKVHYDSQRKPVDFPDPLRSPLDEFYKEIVNDPAFSKAVVTSRLRNILRVTGGGSETKDDGEPSREQPIPVTQSEPTEDHNEGKCFKALSKEYSAANISCYLLLDRNCPIRNEKEEE
ncbi:uncharacterized protein BO88DRAFT_430199 [Aspergillus vadensis CBS 113365]|uniref:Uncharacterized protein n=1 Tax=Aspergillus vadensis (strain CBS 113365 / IMI 142717 / IBT 24658) TaxID=1448311 RepID=A0A319ATT9_ASPVC|nr:hypothetical protein BO88DRAFT_430199 [Aspergillus vadensis CBS 113365]PYH63669.1 hypothetical protein BO88DRAFT_430199 [Aspergillus vadensis CBS 113365]